MKAVNLIPSESRRGARQAVSATQSGGLVYGVLALLAIAVLFATVDVLTSNTIKHRKAKLAAVSAQTAQAQATASRLAPYVTFQQQAQASASTVKEIAAARFDWHAALTNLSRVLPAGTSLNGITGSVAPGASAGSTGTGSGVDVRSDISVPAFELTGCTRNQDEVAVLMSNLRAMDGVTRVTLENSAKANQSTAGTTGGCSSGPAFSLVVFYSPLPTAGPDGVIAAATSTTTGGTTP